METSSYNVSGSVPLNSEAPACRWRFAALVCLLMVVAGGNAFAQSDTASSDATAAGLPAAVFTRQADGRAIVRATRITEPIRLDGRLDEAAYGEVEPISDFIQQEPDNGAPVTERTQAWVLFDDKNIYIACRCWDTHPERIVANDMRRDSPNLGQHDSFAVAFDTFHDGRSGFLLYLTAIGARRDTAIVDERPNADWDPVWDGDVGRFENGWITEMAIPFKSLRYGPGRQQTWGIHLRRTMRGKNEIAYITRVSPQLGNSAIFRGSDGATLIGLEVPPPGLNLEIKPYAMSRLTTDLLSRPAFRNEVDPDAGLDVKMGVTKGLTADFTFNTDFAQVEADEAQVNLTRFALSFPEKREFFLEGQGIFQFGASGGGGPGGGGGSGGGGGGGSGDAPTIFYSRRIGLNGDRVVPVIGGGRLTGKVDAWTLGALNIVTEGDPVVGGPNTTFSVLRIKRDVLRKSVIGGIYTRRSVSTVAPGSNHLWGLDATLAFFQDVYVSGYVAQSKTEGRQGDDLNYRGQFTYNADRYGLSLDRLVVEKNFNPEVGLLRRDDLRRNYAQARFSPRTKNRRFVRKLTYQSSLEYTTDNNNRLESREWSGEFRTDFHNSDGLSLRYERLYEFLPVAFQVSRDIHIPVGGYSFDNVVLGFSPGVHHRLNGFSSFAVGRFYTGHKKTANLRARVEVTPQLGVEPNISLNRIDLPQGSFTTTVVGGRGTFTMTPRMFVAALLQYSSGSTSLSTNLRFRWEYQPGSDLFVVYSEGRSTLPLRGTALEGRGLVVKINRLFRF